MSLNGDVRRLLRESVEPVLLRNKFVRSGWRYTRPFDQVIWLVNVQRSRSSEPGEAIITLNCGVYVPGITRIYAGIEPKAPTEADCCLSVRPVMLLPDGRDRWWRVVAEAGGGDAKSSPAVEMRDAVALGALPFLDAFRDRAAIVRFLSEPRLPRYAPVWPSHDPLITVYLAILRFLDGDTGRACELLRDAAGLSNVREFGKSLEIIRDRMGCAG